MELPQRKKIRVGEYDYSQCGAYFVTICTQNRRPILSNIVGDDAHIVPKRYGQIAEKYLKNAAEIEKYVIMPDHIHMLIRLEEQGAEKRSPQASRIASIVRSIKTLTTKEIGEPIFQRSYYDHVIRNQRDYNEIWEYIENNPRKWLLTKQGTPQHP